MDEKPPKPPFDMVRASFFLVAFVIVAHVALVTMAVGACLWHAEDTIKAGGCGRPGVLTEVLAAALAAALAFAGGRTSGK